MLLTQKKQPQEVKKTQEGIPNQYLLVIDLIKFKRVFFHQIKPSINIILTSIIPLQDINSIHLIGNKYFRNWTLDYN